MVDEYRDSWENGIDYFEFVVFIGNFRKFGWLIIVFCDIKEIFDDEVSLVLLGNLGWWKM